jgi:hypothetical protein
MINNIVYLTEGRLVVYAGAPVTMPASTDLEVKGAIDPANQAQLV